MPREAPFPRTTAVFGTIKSGPDRQTLTRRLESPPNPNASVRLPFWKSRITESLESKPQAKAGSTPPAKATTSASKKWRRGELNPCCKQTCLGMSQTSFHQETDILDPPCYHGML